MTLHILTFAGDEVSTVSIFNADMKRVHRYKGIVGLPWLSWIIRSLYAKHDITSVRWTAL